MVRMSNNSIKNNIKAYTIMFDLEILLRMFISKILQEKFEYGWTKSISPRTLKNCEKRALKERETYQEIFTKDSDLIIDYADFKDLKEIILANWLIFEGFFIRKELIENKLEELEIPRNIIAHNRIISDIELKRISVYANDLKRCMNRM